MPMRTDTTKELLHCKFLLNHLKWVFVTKTNDDIDEANFKAMIRDEFHDLNVGATETISKNNNDNYN